MWRFNVRECVYSFVCDWIGGSRRRSAWYAENDERRARDANSHKTETVTILINIANEAYIFSSVCNNKWDKQNHRVHDKNTLRDREKANASHKYRNAEM